MKIIMDMNISSTIQAKIISPPALVFKVKITIINFLFIGDLTHFLELKQRLTYTIPDQDNLSKKKDRIAKIELLTSILCFTALLIGLWLYNAQHALIEFKFESVPNITLPTLTLCVPTFGALVSSQHVFMFNEYDLANVTRRGQFSTNQNVIEHCSSTNTRFKRENTCMEFIEYDGFCIHIGLNDAFPWSLQTEGKTLLTIVLAYRSELEDTRHLILPYFGWNNTCHSADDPSCTLKDDQHLGIQSLQRNSPFILYQLAPNQLILADIQEEHHITAHGVKSTIYPTSFISFPFDAMRDFQDVCLDLDSEFNKPCRVVYLGIRTLPSVVQRTREENYLSTVIRSIATATSQLSLIMGAAAILFSYFITRLAIKNPSGYINHDLREPMLYLVKESQNKL
jgi:hypothetical protein